MLRRVTITLDPYLETTIRNIQAKKISETNKSISFSNIINEILKKGLKEKSLSVWIVIVSPLIGLTHYLFWRMN